MVIGSVIFADASCSNRPMYRAVWYIACYLHCYNASLATSCYLGALRKFVL